MINLFKLAVIIGLAYFIYTTSGNKIAIPNVSITLPTASVHTQDNLVEVTKPTAVHYTQTNPVNTTLPDCSNVNTRTACEWVKTTPTALPTDIPTPTQEVIEAPAFDPQTVQVIEATATAEIAAVTRAPEYSKPNEVGTCQFIGCLPASNRQQIANYQADCHAYYWQYEGSLPENNDKESVDKCIATGDYK